MIGAPGQIKMSSDDVFPVGPKTFEIKREMSMLEIMCGIEAKNKYRVRAVDGAAGSPPFLFAREQSTCFQRVCCNTCRELDMFVHKSYDDSGPVVADTHKDFSCQSCPCKRPVMKMKRDGVFIGQARSPDAMCCTKGCCKMSLAIDNNTEQEIFKVGNTSLCNCTYFCPCCTDVPIEFPVYRAADESTPVAMLRAMPLTCSEVFGKQSVSQVEFIDNKLSMDDKFLLLNAVLLMDLEYFPPKNDQ